MRLIDADALRLMKVEECAGHSIEYAMGWKACLEYINAAPTVPVVQCDGAKIAYVPATQRNTNGLAGARMRISADERGND